jgi:hypothetical protein
MYISQLFDENNKLKSWKQIITEVDTRSSKGVVPNWFKEIEEIMLKDVSKREVFGIYEICEEKYK